MISETEAQGENMVVAVYTSGLPENPADLANIVERTLQRVHNAHWKRFTVGQEVWICAPTYPTVVITENKGLEILVGELKKNDQNLEAVTQTLLPLNIPIGWPQGKGE